MPKNDCQSRGVGLSWRRRGEIMDASQEARWLAERPAATGYVVIVVSASFGSLGGDAAICFCMHARTGGGRTLSVAEAKSEVGANYEEVKRREDKDENTKLTPLLFMRA